jgi:hypothetical protein
LTLKYGFGIIKHMQEPTGITNLKRWLVSLALLAVMTSSAWADVEVLSLNIYPLGDHARMEWRTGQEIDFQKFVVERSPDGTNYFPVGQINARGAFSEYTFTDASPLDVSSGQTFFYRVKLLNNDGTFNYTQTMEVNLIFSAVQQTWGSIKAMFR